MREDAAESKMSGILERKCSFEAKNKQDEEEVLDPRVQVELEKLNKASEDINRLELALDEARASFRQVLTESTQRLNTLAKKLGSCIEKARPYYEARMKAKEAQIETQNAALRFERACSQQAAAKEMVYLAEQGFFRKGQPFDPAWQEMLNHATMKVNDAEKERLESEVEHQQTALVFNEAEQHVKQLHRDLKRNINKSRPYFEMKARFNQQMEDQKHRVGALEKALVESKCCYSEALRNLEAISDQIHEQRREAKLRDEMGTRGSGVGAEAPSPPPDSDYELSPTEGGQKEIVTDTGQEIMKKAVARTNSQTQTDISPTDSEPGTALKKHESQVYSDEHCALPSAKSEGCLYGQALGLIKRSSSRPTSIDPNRDLPSTFPERSNGSTKTQGIRRLSKTHSADRIAAISASLNIPSSPSRLTPSSILDSRSVSDSVSESGPSVEVLSPCSEPSYAQGTMTSPETENEADAENTKTNAEIMETLQKSKDLGKFFLRPNRSRDDLLDEASDNESIPGSLASVSVLDDEQIESLMLETGEFVSYLMQQDEMEAARWKGMSLPARLSYLQDYVKFKPSWVEDEEATGRAEHLSSSDKPNGEANPNVHSGRLNNSHSEPLERTSYSSQGQRSAAALHGSSPLATCQCPVQRRYRSKSLEITPGRMYDPRELSRILPSHSSVFPESLNVKHSEVIAAASRSQGKEVQAKRELVQATLPNRSAESPAQTQRAIEEEEELFV